ncbi:gliding motility-associated C-terminal domain-containing protein [Pedobacter glucosidilyticus]|uniref:T9SS type B sorting domain-containing protein n=1 Tax=Pedobacter glucosidilyticus TaxID=1122941 RepID=UPI0026EF987F|nr:gliding motility-associated C-terminal domain-containing protein [Pedobacter glucosidilyticus]
MINFVLKYSRKSLLFLFLLSCFSTLAQPNKDGNLTITTAKTVVNRYTRVVADINAGTNKIIVSNINDLNRDNITYLPAGYTTNNSVFANNVLANGDLILIYQAQGASINTSNTVNYGNILDFNGAGRYEFAYVESTNGNEITLICGTKLSYFSRFYVQVIRIPQYNNLTINTGASITSIPWGSPSFGTDPDRNFEINGITLAPSSLTRRRGGFTAIHATNIVNNGSINSNFAGFRGGTIDPYTNEAGSEIVKEYRSKDPNRGAEKGESIAGYREDYEDRPYPNTIEIGRWGRGAPANGGGGGNAHNAGGGGGSNGGNPNNWFRGAGVMNDFGGSCASDAWKLDPDYIANNNQLTNSSGGGRGGYTFAGLINFALVDGDACTVGPSYAANEIAPNIPPTDILNISWGGDYRVAAGGLGGRPLISPNLRNQLFFGGGGGAGDGNDSSNSDGGDGGGILFLIVANGLTGNGSIEANGEDATNTINTNNDAPGGGGGGGTVLIQSNTIASTLTINANGGKGGSQLITNFESEGPGGGGGGGVISINATSDASTKNVKGGINGRTTSLAMTEFLANGSTSGSEGSIINIPIRLDVGACDVDLEIRKTINNNTPNVNSNVTFTLEAINNGPGDITGVVVEDLLPNGYTLVSTSATKGSYTTPNWNIGSLMASERATLTVVATVLLNGSYTNTAVIRGDKSDSNVANNTSTVTPSPRGIADLEVTKTLPSNYQVVGTTSSFTITVKNNGPSVARNIIVNDVLPTGYTLVSATSSAGIWNAPNWVLDILNSGQSQTLVISATVNATGNYTNTATVSSSSQTDPNPLNNISTITPKIIGAGNDAGNVNGKTGGVAIVNILVNDNLNGLPASVNNVDIIQISTTNSTINISTNNGQVVVPPGTTPGIYTINYRITDKTDPLNTTTATVIVTVNSSPVLGLAKSASAVVVDANGINTVTYTITAENLGNIELNNLNITDNLRVTFPDPLEFNLVGGLTTTGNLIANNSFNGISVINLLNGGSLIPGERQSVSFTLQINTKKKNGTYLNTANATAESIDGTVNDTSTNGINSDPDNNGVPDEQIPTPVILRGTSIYIPEGFSPNGDGTHDNFVIENPNNDLLLLEIYNRWGNLVFKDPNYQNTWNGISNQGIRIGEDLPDGTYFYILIVNQQERYTGYITLKR